MVMAFRYTYDDVGNITQETRDSVQTTYVYDGLGQLTRVNDPNDTTSGSSGTTHVASGVFIVGGAVSLIGSILPGIAIAPIAQPLGIVCTVGGIVIYIIQSIRIGGDEE